MGMDKYHCLAGMLGRLRATLPRSVAPTRLASATWLPTAHLHLFHQKSTGNGCSKRRRALFAPSTATSPADRGAICLLISHPCCMTCDAADRLVANVKPQLYSLVPNLTVPDTTWAHGRYGPIAQESSSEIASAAWVWLQGTRRRRSGALAGAWVGQSAIDVRAIRKRACWWVAVWG
jgi:hypothetical protein